MSDRATKKCPFCGEEILAEAIKCRWCGEFLNKAERREDDSRFLPDGYTICRNCGKAISGNEKTCRFCGKSPYHKEIPPSPPARPEPTAVPLRYVMFCPNCGAQIPQGMSICPICNFRLNTTGVFNDSNGTAIAAFVMALLSLFLPILTLPAIICGHIGLNHSRRTMGHTGQGLATAALVIGYLTVAFWVIMLLFFANVVSALFS